MSHQYNPCEIFVQGNYYVYDEELYDISFPREWATNHAPGTGPKECRGCIQVGSWRGVFIGYCAGCSTQKYQLQRSGGFVSRGIENNNAPSSTRPFATYLKNKSLSRIGDIDFNPGDDDIE